MKLSFVRLHHHCVIASLCCSAEVSFVPLVFSDGIECPHDSDPNDGQLRLPGLQKFPIRVTRSWPCSTLTAVSKHCHVEQFGWITFNTLRLEVWNTVVLFLVISVECKSMLTSCIILNHSYHCHSFQLYIHSLAVAYLSCTWFKWNLSPVIYFLPFLSYALSFFYNHSLLFYTICWKGGYYESTKNKKCLGWRSGFLWPSIQSKMFCREFLLGWTVLLVN